MSPTLATMRNHCTGPTSTASLWNMYVKYKQVALLMVWAMMKNSQRFQLWLFTCLKLSEQEPASKATAVATKHRTPCVHMKATKIAATETMWWMMMVVSIDTKASFIMYANSTYCKARKQANNDAQAAQASIVVSLGATCACAHIQSATGVGSCPAGRSLKHVP